VTEVHILGRPGDGGGGPKIHVDPGL